MEITIYYDRIEGPIRIPITAPITYFFMIAVLRLSGKKSKWQMNNFDWIVTMAVGHIVASKIVLDGIILDELAWRPLFSSRVNMW